jgi:glycosyltransferase involved in cell wall biosynthesis
MFDAWDGAALDIIRVQLPDARLIAITTGGLPDEADLCLTVTPGTRDALLGGGDLDASVVHSVDFHVPVNPLASERRHNALGTTGYLLVLTDRHGAEVDGQPNPAASWLTARFPRENVLVVEEGSASLWHLRSLHGVMSVDTRTDLWRLVAHARAVIDLAPGPYIARECLEALRFGTPIIVPSATVAAEHAANGGGLSFSDAAELMASAEVLEDPSLRDRFSKEGRTMADARFGDRAAFVANMGQALRVARENSRWCPKGS